MLSLVTSTQVFTECAGDSRAYWVPLDGGPAVQLTTDDSALQSYMDLMGLSAEQAARMPHASSLTRGLGMKYEWREPNPTAHELTGRGVVALVSDGPIKKIGTPDAIADQVRAQLARTSGNLLAAAQGFATAAVDAGTRDNVTVVLIAGPDPSGRGETPPGAVGTSPWTKPAHREVPAPVDPRTLPWTGGLPQGRAHTTRSAESWIGKVSGNRSAAEIVTTANPYDHHEPGARRVPHRRSDPPRPSTADPSSGTTRAENPAPHQAGEAPGRRVDEGLIGSAPRSEETSSDVPAPPPRSLVVGSAARLYAVAADEPPGETPGYGAVLDTTADPVWIEAHDGSNRISPAVTDFHDLPDDVLSEYVRLAEIAVPIVRAALASGTDVSADDFLDDLGSRIHNGRLQRHWRTATPEQRLPFDDPGYPEQLREHHRRLARAARDSVVAADAVDRTVADPFRSCTTGAAVAAEMWRRHAVRMFGFDMPGIPVELVRELARAIHQLLTKYPYVQLLRTGFGPVSGPRLLAVSDHVAGTDTRYPYTRSITVSDAVAADRGLFASVWADMVNSGRAVGSVAEPVLGLIRREFGYSLNIATRLIAQRKAQTTLIDHHENSHQGPTRWSPREAFAWSSSQFREYGPGEKGRLNSAAALAGAFAAMEHDPRDTSVGEQVLHNLLAELAPQRQAEKDRGREQLTAEYRPVTPMEQQAKLAMAAALRADYGIDIIGLDNPGIPAATAGDLIAAIRHMIARFPILLGDSSEIRILSEVRIVPGDVGNFGHTSFEGIEFNELWMTAPARMHAEAIEQLAAKRLRLDLDRVYFCLAIHELAHLLRRLLPVHAPSAHEVVSRAFEERYGSNDIPALRAWMATQFSSYGIRQEDGALQPDEAEAESVVAAEVDSLTPTEGEAIVHRNFSELAAAEAERRGLPSAEPPIGSRPSSDATESGGRTAYTSRNSRRSGNITGTARAARGATPWSSGDTTPTARKSAPIVDRTDEGTPIGSRPGAVPASLSPDHLRVLLWISRGWTDAEITEELGGKGPAWRYIWELTQRFGFPTERYLMAAEGARRNLVPVQAPFTELRKVLTPRQIVVLAYLSRGLSKREIADKLSISRRTVDTSVDRSLHRIESPSLLMAMPRLVGALDAFGETELARLAESPTDTIAEPGPGEASVNRLTAEEEWVLRLARRGLTHSEIAAEMGTVVAQVRRTLADARKKAGVSRKDQDAALLEAEQARLKEKQSRQAPRPAAEKASPRQPSRSAMLPNLPNPWTVTPSDSGRPGGQPRTGPSVDGGVRTGRPRVETSIQAILEARLLIERKFLDIALVSGQPRPWELFGEQEWLGHLDAREFARGYRGPLTVEFIRELHRKLAARTMPEFGGLLQGTRVRGWGTLHEPLTEEQIAVVDENPLLTYCPGPFTSGEHGIVMHPVVNGEEGAATYRLLESPLTDSEKAAIGADALTSYVPPGEFSEHGLILYPRFRDISAELEKLCTWFNEATTDTARSRPDFDPYAIAAKLQQWFISLHPAQRDYNGRVSRLLMNWFLEKVGLWPSAIEEFDLDIVTRLPEWTEIIRAGSLQYGRWAVATESSDPATDLVTVFGLERKQANYRQAGGRSAPFTPGAHHDADEYARLYHEISQTVESPRHRMIAHGRETSGDQSLEQSTGDSIEAKQTVFQPNPDTPAGELLALGPSFDYIRTLMRIAAEHPHGPSWIGTPDYWSWNLSWLAERGPRISMLAAFFTAALEAERTLGMTNTGPGPLVIVQERPRTADEMLPVHKYVTLRRDTPEESSSAGTADLATVIGGIGRKLSLDELLQYWTLHMVAARTILDIDVTRTHEELAAAESTVFRPIPREGVFGWNFPGCRALPREHRPYLRARWAGDVLLPQVACRETFEFYLTNVVEPYLLAEARHILDEFDSATPSPENEVARWFTSVVVAAMAAPPADAPEILRRALREYRASADNPLIDHFVAAVRDLMGDEYDFGRYIQRNPRPEFLQFARDLQEVVRDRYDPRALAGTPLFANVLAAARSQTPPV
ncbi:hypothetical protein B7C42_04223 [Nocardia cerradoensis]|uniref:Uncharacterized protein n=1 Tax=Nocardia cerradoensis TaxID=85688 RepID=A0A231H546_9NOCA|nr:hypothetical protein B7C42_04223 [Nocardia cerradoensis]